MNESIFIGWDPREAAAFAVARSTIRMHLTRPIPIYGLVLSDLIKRGLYTRPIERRPSAADRPIMWDTISDAPMSTEHANARFLVPHLAKEGWALFMDGDMMARGNVARVFEGLDRSKAVYCVHHRHNPPEGVKMDMQMQTRYARKNWTSFIIFRADHPANKRLTLDMINGLPGRDLHRLCWLEDEEIGELDPKWNWLAGHSDPSIDPIIVHHTDGVPDMQGYEDAAFSDEWRDRRNDWVRGPLSFGS